METAILLLIISSVFFGGLSLLASLRMFRVTTRLFYFLIVSFLICFASSFILYKTNVYNKTSSAICRNIEKNPESWNSIFPLDTMEITKYNLSHFSNLISHSEHLVNKSCGIDLQVDSYGFYAYIEAMDGDSVLQVFNNEDSRDILEAFNQYIVQPKKEYQARLMEPIELVKKWKEEEKANALKDKLESCQ